MLKRIFLFTLLITVLIIGSQAVSEKTASAAGTGTSDASGTFSVTVSGADVAITASTGVYMTITTDADTATTSANVTAIHPKGERMFGMDSDGGPLYYMSTAVGEVAATAVTAVTGTDDFTGVGTWTEL